MGVSIYYYTVFYFCIFYRSFLSVPTPTIIVDKFTQPWMIDLEPIRSELKDGNLALFLRNDGIKNT